MRNDKTIESLREMVRRGDPGEQANAKRILDKMGVPYEAPKNPIKDRVKQTFGADIDKTYQVSINYLSDMLFMNLLLRRIGAKSPAIRINKEFNMEFNCTKAQMKDISAIFNKHRADFDVKMVYEGEWYMDSYFN